jgi:predicted transcriptional regulator
MGDLKKLDFEEPAAILEEEDEETLAAIDRGIKAADEGRVVSLDDARRRMQTWLTKSSSPKPTEARVLLGAVE